MRKQRRQDIQILTEIVRQPVHLPTQLYENYIKPAQDKGVTVVVCTPIVRRTATKDWANSNRSYYIGKRCI